jgi:putative ABC transport system substrate-binding protein
MISRRRFLVTVSAGFVAAPLVTDAQGVKTARVAFLGNASASLTGPLLDAFRGGLRDLGYVEGQNLVIESSFADGKPERIQ